MYPGTCSEKPESFYLFPASDPCGTKGRHVKNSSKVGVIGVLVLVKVMSPLVK